MLACMNTQVAYVNSIVIMLCLHCKVEQSCTRMDVYIGKATLRYYPYFGISGAHEGQMSFQLYIMQSNRETMLSAIKSTKKKAQIIASGLYVAHLFCGPASTLNEACMGIMYVIIIMHNIMTFLRCAVFGSFLEGSDQPRSHTRTHSNARTHTYAHTRVHARMNPHSHKARTLKYAHNVIDTPLGLHPS